MISRRKKRAARTILLGVLAGTGVLHGMELTNSKYARKPIEDPKIERTVKKIETIQRVFEDSVNFPVATYATYLALKARRRHLKKKKAERIKRQHKRLERVFE